MARVGGSRGRLIGAAVVLLLALEPRGEVVVEAAGTGEKSGAESHSDAGRRSDLILVMRMMLVMVDRVLNLISH